MKNLSTKICIGIIAGEINSRQLKLSPPEDTIEYISYK